MVFGKDCELKGTIIKFKKSKNVYGEFFLCQVKLFNHLFKIIINNKVFIKLGLKERKQILVYQIENDKTTCWKFDEQGTINFYKRREELKKELTKD